MLTTDDWVTLALFGAAIVAIVSLGIWAHRIRQAAGGGPDWFVRVVVGIGLGKALDGGGGDGGGGDGGD